MVPDRSAAKANARCAGAAVDPVNVLRRQHRAHQRNVLEAAANHAEGIEIVALHLDADTAELAKARFVADDSTKRGRPDRRATSLRAEADRHLKIGDRRSRAARRAARRVRRIVRMNGFAWIAVGK